MGLGVTAPSAVAGSVDVEGVTVTWDDALLVTPSGYLGCRTVPITVTNARGPRLLAVDVFMTGTDGKREAVIGAGLIGLDPGESTTVKPQFCTTNEFGTQIKGGDRTATMELVARHYPSDRLPDVTTTARLAFGPPVTIPIIAPQAEVCVIDSIDEDKDYCARPFYLKLDITALAIGDWDPEIRLYGRGGRVKARVDLTDFETSLVPKSFPPGRYMIVSTNGSAGHWSCSIYNYDVCNWISSRHDVLAYKFQWDGKRVQRIERVPASKIASVRL